MLSLLSSGVSGRRVAGRLRCLFVAAVWTTGVIALTSTHANAVAVSCPSSPSAGDLVATVDTSPTASSCLAAGGTPPGEGSVLTAAPYNLTLIDKIEFDDVTGTQTDTGPVLGALTINFTTNYSAGTFSISAPLWTNLVLVLKDGGAIDWVAFLLGETSGAWSIAVDGNVKDLSHASLYGVAVPGPIVGAGLPGLLLACGGLLLLARRRRLNALAA